jgi:hypothetical protein
MLVCGISRIGPLKHGARQFLPGILANTIARTVKA